jgi:hypothetical protein
LTTVFTWGGVSAAQAVRLKRMARERWVKMCLINEL